MGLSPVECGFLPTVSSGYAMYLRPSSGRSQIRLLALTALNRVIGGEETTYVTQSPMLGSGWPAAVEIGTWPATLLAVGCHRQAVTRAFQGAVMDITSTHSMVRLCKMSVSNSLA